MKKISDFLNAQLQTGESIIFTGTISKKPLVVNIITSIIVCTFFGFLGTVGYVLIGVAILLTICLCIEFGLYFISSEFIVTNQRILGKTGLISRNTFEIPLKQGEGLQIRQGLAGRIFGYGHLTSSGTGASRIGMMYLNDPFMVRKRVIEATGKGMSNDTTVETTA